MVGYPLTKSLLSRAVDWAGGDPDSNYVSGEKLSSKPYSNDPDLNYLENEGSGATTSFQKAIYRMLPHNRAKRDVDNYRNIAPYLHFGPYQTAQHLNDGINYFKQQWENARNKKNSNHLPGNPVTAYDNEVSSVTALDPYRQFPDGELIDLNVYPQYNPVGNFHTPKDIIMDYLPGHPRYLGPLKGPIKTRMSQARPIDETI